MNIFKKTKYIYIIWGEIHINKWLQYTRDSTLQYSVINYSHHVVPYIHRTYLFSNRKFISFDHLHSFCSSPTPPSSLAVTHLFSISVSFCLVVCFQIPQTSEILWYLSFYLFFIYFIQHNPLLVHPCCDKWQDFILFLAE